MQEIHRETTGAASQATPSRSEVIGFALDEHFADPLKGNCSRDGPYRTPLWSFTRVVRSHFGMGVDADRVFWQLVAPEIERRGGWELLETELEFEEIYFEFVCNWDAVRFRIGETALENAIAKADSYPLRPSRSSKHPGYLQRYARFISIAGWLQATMGDRPILLPVEKLAAVVGGSPMAITRYRQTAVADGYLRIVGQHVYSKGLATEFRFDVSRFPGLDERVAASSSMLR